MHVPLTHWSFSTIILQWSRLTTVWTLWSHFTRDTLIVIGLHTTVITSYLCVDISVSFHPWHIGRSLLWCHSDRVLPLFWHCGLISPVTHWSFSALMLQWSRHTSVLTLWLWSYFTRDTSVILCFDTTVIVSYLCLDIVSFHPWHIGRSQLWYYSDRVLPLSWQCGLISPVTRRSFSALILQWSCLASVLTLSYFTRDTGRSLLWYYSDRVIPLCWHCLISPVTHW